MWRSEEAGVGGMRRRAATRAPLRWGSKPAPRGRTFEEELELFERQARAEAGNGAGRGLGRAGAASDAPYLAPLGDPSPGGR